MCETIKWDSDVDSEDDRWIMFASVYQWELKVGIQGSESQKTSNYKEILITIPT